MTRIRLIAGIAASIIVAVACTGTNPSLVAGSPTGPAPRTASPTPSASPGVPVEPLCKPLPTPTPSPLKAGKLPPAIAEVAREVQQVRRLRFKRRVAPEPLNRRQLERQLRSSLDDEFPPEEAAREGKTLTTIGALPSGTNFRRAVVEFGTSQIVGFYDTLTHRLVFQGGRSPTPYGRFVLAHELTHALQDQNFDLSRLDKLSAECQDDRAEALSSLAEGDAVVTQIQWARRELSLREIGKLQDEARSFPPPPASTPSFIERMFLFPYGNGQAFVEALLARGGQRAVDNAFRHPPASTEQILHPAKFPGDPPRAVQIPDLSGGLGQGWSLLDQEEVGEGWLLVLMGLRLSTADSEDAASGWDGGLLRTWTSGPETAVLIQTVWDTVRDAREFGAAMRDWIEARPAQVQQAGATVRVLFGSDRAALRALRAAAGQA